MPRLVTPLICLALAACADTENPTTTNEEEVITTVELTFTPPMGDALVFVWSDPEADGAPIVDAVQLADATAYDLTVRFLNSLEDPPEDITVEVAEEDDEHQVFFTGSAVQGPATGANASAIATHAYTDEDADGAPVGLANTFTTTGSGSGELTVTLRHLPPEGDAAVKTGTLAEDVAAGGFGSIPGDNDVQVTFPVTVP